MITANTEMTEFIFTFICLPTATLAAWCIFVVACFELMSRDLHGAIGPGSTNEIEFVAVPGAPAQTSSLDGPGTEVGLVKQLEFPSMAPLARPL
jgi:hypothetical protein